MLTFNAVNLDQQRRYARQIMLAEVGEAGQRKLLGARVLVIGAGGLGSALISYLAAAGVGTIGIIDPDRVELSNLARQIIHETGDIGRLKVESASDRVAEINPEVKVIPYPFALTEANALKIIQGCPSPEKRPGTGALNSDQPMRFSTSPKGEVSEQASSHAHNVEVGKNTSPLGEVGAPEGSTKSATAYRAAGEGQQPYDIIADGCDNFQTRFIVNRAALEANIPLVSAAIAGWQGQVMTIAPHLAPGTGCYQCYAHPDAPEANTCRESGIMGPLAGIIGSCQALEVINTLLGRPALVGKLLRYDGRSMTQSLSTTTRDAGCEACG